MRIGWVGFHIEGLPALRAVLEQGIPVEAFITLAPERAAKRSGATDYTSLCREFHVPIYQIANINDHTSRQLLSDLSLDLVFVIGWSQIVSRETLQLARVGMIGAHASFLPHNRGRAPINWALIHGEPQTGNSLIWLAEGVDEGEIIDQTMIPITPYDTCASLYERVAESNKDMILRAIPKLLAGERIGKPQIQTEESKLPGRRPEDGLVSWFKTNVEIYNFVRALTRPYPGAFSWLDGTRWQIWQCALLPDIYDPAARAGQIIGSVFSPIENACGQLVACGKGTLLLLELERDDGEILTGRRLSDQQWKGRVWNNGT
jgi:methionyl-tRNA formyltransferase